VAGRKWTQYFWFDLWAFLRKQWFFAGIYELWLAMLEEETLKRTWLAFLSYLDGHANVQESWRESYLLFANHFTNPPVSLPQTSHIIWQSEGGAGDAEIPPLSQWVRRAPYYSIRLFTEKVIDAELNRMAAQIKSSWRRMERTGNPEGFGRIKFRPSFRAETLLAAIWSLFACDTLTTATLPVKICPAGLELFTPRRTTQEFCSNHLVFQRRANKRRWKVNQPRNSDRE
jgi:hypothetical protein